MLESLLAAPEDRNPGHASGKQGNMFVCTETAAPEELRVNEGQKDQKTFQKLQIARSQSFQHFLRPKTGRK